MIKFYKCNNCYNNIFILFKAIEQPLTVCKQTSTKHCWVNLLVDRNCV